MSNLDYKFDIKFVQQSFDDCGIELEDISGWFKSDEGGPYLKEFQKKFAKLCESKYALGVSSGSVSIYVALKACGIDGKSYVAVPAYTHIGSVAPIVLAGAKPVFIDVDQYGNIDPSCLENKIKDYNNIGINIDAVIVVHQLGLPCNMDEIIEVSGDAFIIEDASHSLGAEYKGCKTGTLGYIGCFSVGGGRTKTIGVGEGGMIVTNDSVLAEKCKNIRNHGDRNTDVNYFCFNFRMSDLNAAIGLMMIDRAGLYNDWQIKNAEYIVSNIPDYLEVIPTPTCVKSVRYIIGCHFLKERHRLSRDDFLSKLKKFQVGPRKFIGGGYSKLISDVRYYTRFIDYDLPMSNKLRDESVWIDYHRYPRTKIEIDEMLNDINNLK